MLNTDLFLAQTIPLSSPNFSYLKKKKSLPHGFRMLLPCLETRLSMAMVQHQDSVWGISQSHSAPLPPQSLSVTWLTDRHLPHHPQRGFRKHLSRASAHGLTIEPSGFHTPGIQWRNKHWTGGGEKEQEKTQLKIILVRPPATGHLPSLLKPPNSTYNCLSLLLQENCWTAL